MIYLVVHIVIYTYTIHIIKIYTYQGPKKSYEQSAVADKIPKRFRTGELAAEMLYVLPMPGGRGLSRMRSRATSTWPPIAAARTREGWNAVKGCDSSCQDDISILLSPT